MASDKTIEKEKVQQLSIATVAFDFKMSSNSELKADKERSTSRKRNRRKRKNETVIVPGKWSFVLGRSHCLKRFPVMFKVLSKRSKLGIVIFLINSW